jgi:hypothetical protein
MKSAVYCVWELSAALNHKIFDDFAGNNRYIEAPVFVCFL